MASSGRLVGGLGAFMGGIFPRSDGLIEHTRRPDEKLRAHFRREKTSIIELQMKVGLDYVCDPMCDWDDLLRPFVQGWKGVRPGPLMRYYETNTFYRQPLIIGELGDGTVAVRSLDLDLLPSEAPKKALLPEPYTFCHLAEDRYYRKLEDFLLAVADLLAEEAKALREKGFTLLQLSGPSLGIVRDPNTFGLIKEAIGRITRAFYSKIYLHVFFFDVSPILDALLDMPVDGIGIDLTSTPLEGLEKRGWDKGLAAGLIDATNTKMERAEEVRSMALRLLEKVQPKELFITNNCDLEFLPYRFARRKLHILGRAKRLLLKEMGYG